MNVNGSSPNFMAPTPTAKYDMGIGQNYSVTIDRNAHNPEDRLIKATALEFEKDICKLAKLFKDCDNTHPKDLDQEENSVLMKTNKPVTKNNCYMGESQQIDFFRIKGNAATYESEEKIYDDSAKITGTFLSYAEFEVKNGEIGDLIYAKREIDQINKGFQSLEIANKENGLVEYKQQYKAK